MFPDHSKPYIEKVYLSCEKNFDETLNMFISGILPKEQTENLEVIIKQEDANKQQIVSTTYGEIQEKKKKQDLRKYIMTEYSDILGGANHEKMKGHKYY